MAGLILDENKAAGITGSKYLEGVSNVDPGTLIESGFLLPYVTDKKTSWLDYRCALSVELDPGVVLHKILPQSQQDVDTLASGVFDPPPKLVRVTQVVPTGGIVNQNVVKLAQGTPFDELVAQANTTSAGKYTDTVQRMATSRYWFCLKGWAIRAGYRIPIPGLTTVCGVPAIPDNPQKVLSDSEIIANYSGVPIYFSQWELWYFINVPPKQAQTPPPNLAEHITADVTLPKGMQAPLTQPDPQAVEAATTPPKINPQPALRQQ